MEGDEIKLELKKKKKKPQKTPRYFEQDEVTESKETTEENIDEKLVQNLPHSSSIKPKVKSSKPQDGNYVRRKRKQNLLLEKPDIDPELLMKYSRGPKIDVSGVKTNFFKEKLKRKEIYIEYATEQAAKAEVLLREDQGFIIPDEDERTVDYRQDEIVKNVDITSAAKHFNLALDFGPYRFRYTKNGRQLLLGGKKGHVAAFDWVTKKLHCEMNVMEEVVDISWLHLDRMFACAQKKWVYIYDNKGTELHCVKKLNFVNRLDFLPYHFLLAAGNSQGYLSWLDVSIGQLVGNFKTRLGDIRLMQHNPANGVLCVGGSKGVVSMWAPKVKEPLAKLLCHPTPLTSLAVDNQGIHLYTSGLDKTVKIWDIRELSGPLNICKLRMAANEVVTSQKGTLAVSMGNVCEIYNNILDENTNTPYLRHRADKYIHKMDFCPYEDVLGVSTDNGFHSILVPGCGEPNFDAFEDNPFQTRSQRREREVHSLLEKIPAELISLDPGEIIGVDVGSLTQKVEEKKKLLFLKPPKIDFKSRRKMKGKGGSVNAARNKQIVRDAARKEFTQNASKLRKELIDNYQVVENEKESKIKEEPSVLDRFKKKKNK